MFIEISLGKKKVFSSHLIFLIVYLHFLTLSKNVINHISNKVTVLKRILVGDPLNFHIEKWPYL